jgi:hypothetical protein
MGIIGKLARILKNDFALFSEGISQLIPFGLFRPGLSYSLKAILR